MSLRLASKLLFSHTLKCCAAIFFFSKSIMIVPLVQKFDTAVFCLPSPFAIFLNYQGLILLQELFCCLFIFSAEECYLKKEWTYSSVNLLQLGTGKMEAVRRISDNGRYQRT